MKHLYGRAFGVIGIGATLCRNSSSQTATSSRHQVNQVIGPA